MYLIQRITSDASQKQSFILYNGNILTIEMVYSDSQQGWFITNLIYGTFVLKGIRIVVSPNILNQFVNIIDFGLGCFTKEKREPSLLQDFSSQLFNLYILTKTEVNEYNELLKIGKLNASR